MHSQEKLIIDFVTDFDKVAVDKKVFPELESSDNIPTIEETVDKNYQWFGESEILIWDPHNPANSLYFQACILDFCYLFGSGVQSLLEGEREEAHAFGREQGQYFVSMRILNKKLHIKSNGSGKLCEYDVDEFVKVFTGFVRKVVRALPMIYEGLEDNQMFLNSQKYLEYWTK